MPPNFYPNYPPRNGDKRNSKKFDYDTNHSHHFLLFACISNSIVEIVKSHSVRQLYASFNCTFETLRVNRLISDNSKIPSLMKNLPKIDNNFELYLTHDWKFYQGIETPSDLFLSTEKKKRGLYNVLQDQNKIK